MLAMRKASPSGHTRTQKRVHQFTPFCGWLASGLESGRLSRGWVTTTQLSHERIGRFPEVP
jgi:hypothetical protein